MCVITPTMIMTGLVVATTVAQVGISIAQAVDGDLSGAAKTMGNAAMTATAGMAINKMIGNDSFGDIFGDSTPQQSSQTQPNLSQSTQMNAQQSSSAAQQKPISINSVLNDNPFDSTDNFISGVKDTPIGQSYQPSVNTQQSATSIPMQQNNTPTSVVRNNTPAAMQSGNQGLLAINSDLGQQQNAAQTTNGGLLSQISGFMKENPDLVKVVGSGLSSMSENDSALEQAKIKANAPKELRDSASITNITSKGYVIPQYDPSTNTWH